VTGPTAISLADRGLTEEPDGTQLQLALNDNPAAKVYQQAMFQQGQPAAMLFTDDVKGDYERVKARGESGLASWISAPATSEVRNTRGGRTRPRCATSCTASGGREPRGLAVISGRHALAAPEARQVNDITMP